MKILGIETSCDETAAAVVEDGVRILSNQIASQVEIHARYGGIVPEVASRQHILATLPAPFTLALTKYSSLILCREIKAVSELEKKADSSRQTKRNTRYSVSTLDI